MLLTNVAPINLIKNERKHPQDSNLKWFSTEWGRIDCKTCTCKTIRMVKKSDNMSLKKILNLLESPLMRGVEPWGQESWD